MVPLAELLLTLSPATLRALVAAFGPIPDLAPKAAPFEIVRAVSAFAARGASRKTTELLWTILPRFATRAGRLALVEAARALDDSRADGWLALPAADVAALLAIDLATGDGATRRAAKRLFALADQRIDRDLLERPTYELLADSPVDRDPKSVLATLRHAFGDRLLRAWPALEPDGTLGFALFLRQPAENRLVVDESGSSAIRVREDVPVVVDELRIFPAGDRVALTTAMPERLPEYAQALGLSLRPTFTLRTLRKLTVALLAALQVPGVLRVEIVGARLRGPNTVRIELRGPEVLDPSHQAANVGYFDRATIRVTLKGGQKIDAFFQLPHRLDISQRRFEAPVRAVLAALGFFDPGALPDDARSLAPYEHGAWRWCAVVRDAHFERMKAQGRFVRVASAHVVTEEYRMHGAAYVVREVPGEPTLQYALAEDRSLGARLVTAKERVAWRLDAGVLAASMRRDVGASPADAPLVVNGVLDLGIVSLPSGRLRLVYVMGEPPRGWLESLRRACGLGVTPVLFVPRGHAGGASGVLEIELDPLEQLGAKGLGRALGRAAEALGVASEVERWRLHDEEVVVEAATQTVWILGVRVPLKERAYGLVAHLAPTGGRVVATKEIGACLSSAGSPDVTARKAKAELEKQAREALEGAGVDASIVGKIVIAEGRKGYRLGVGARAV